MAVVADASVVYKWLVVEHDSAAALALRAEHDVTAPDLMLMECRNALLTKVRQKKLTREQAVYAESQIGISEINIVPSAPLLSHAFALALQMDGPLYDCVYLAAAIAADQMLVTADARFAAMAAKLPVGRNRVALLGTFTG